MRYLRRTSNYQKRIELYDLTHVMSTVDLIAISVETTRVNSKSSLENEFIELICMNLTINHVDSCHGCVCGLLT